MPIIPRTRTAMTAKIMIAVADIIVIVLMLNLLRTMMSNFEAKIRQKVIIEKR